MIEHIFLDLDDVLNCFTMYALQSVGCDVSEDVQDTSDFLPEWKFDIVKAANALYPAKLRFPIRASFWHAITRHVWATAPKSAEFNWLIRTCEGLVGRDNVCILTAPIDDPECLAGKLEWIHEFLPRWLRRQYIITWQKHLCAKSESLLIDDSDKNVQNFERNGGRAILMPRPWNHCWDVVDPLTHVSKMLCAEFHKQAGPSIHRLLKR